MARETGAVCRMCRREGAKLFFKGTRCDTDKCAFHRRPTPPGMHNYRRGKQTDYGLHLREKQKVKHYYGVLEGQFRHYFAKAERSKGNTGKVLMSLLERRLDNIVHRIGFGLSRSQARQWISHGHILVNSKRVDIASYQVKVGDTITVKKRPKSLEAIKNSIAENTREVPDFLVRTDGDNPEGQVIRLPEAEDVSIPVESQLIVELCSK